MRSAEFLYLFERIIFPLVQDHKPQIIFFSYPFSFTHSHDNPFILKPKILGILLTRMVSITNFKVILINNLKLSMHGTQDDLLNKRIINLSAENEKLINK